MNTETKPTINEAIEDLSKKAKDTHDAGDALKFSQAALNLAHVMMVKKQVELK